MSPELRQVDLKFFAVFTVSLDIIGIFCKFRCSRSNMVICSDRRACSAAIASRFSDQAGRSGSGKTPSGAVDDEDADSIASTAFWIAPRFFVEGNSQ